MALCATVFRIVGKDGAEVHQCLC